MSLLLLIPLLLETLLCCLLFFCALFVKYVHLLAVIAYLGRGKASEPYDHESEDGNGRAGRVDGEITSSQQILEGVSRTYVGQRTVRGVLRGSCWVECDSDEEYSSEDEDNSENGHDSEDEIIESSKDYAQWKDGGEDIQSELGSGVDTPATSCSGHSTAFSLSGVGSRRRRCDRDGEEQKPSYEGAGAGD